MREKKIDQKEKKNPNQPNNYTIKKKKQPPQIKTKNKPTDFVEPIFIIIVKKKPMRAMNIKYARYFKISVLNFVFLKFFFFFFRKLTPCFN